MYFWQRSSGAAKLELLLILLFVGFIAVGRWYFNSAGFKGAVGERRVNRVLSRQLPEGYFLFSDLTLPTVAGTTQIDHIVVSRFGVFVIETKNMQGWIFGDGNQPKWTQTIYGHKTRFQNPLRQNFKHVKAIEKCLDISQGDIHNLVVFAGTAEPRTYMPSGVSWSGSELVDSILSHRLILLDEAEVTAITEKLLSGNFETTRRRRREHIANSKEAFDLCPKCGSELVRRTNKRNNTEFLGCSHFPKCRGTRAIN